MQLDTHTVVYSVNPLTGVIHNLNLSFLALEDYSIKQHLAALAEQGYFLVDVVGPIYRFADGEEVILFERTEANFWPSEACNG